MGSLTLKGQEWRESLNISTVPWSLMWTDVEMNMLNVLAKDYHSFSLGKVAHYLKE